MPWFAWIAIIAILVWGGLSVFSMITGRPLPGSDGSGGKELEDLKKRVAALESGQVRPEVERRIDRLEARVEKRELREDAHDDWTRRARDLGLDEGGEPKGGAGTGA
jgi:hypothetical protein